MRLLFILFLTAGLIFQPQAGDAVESHVVTQQHHQDKEDGADHSCCVEGMQHQKHKDNPCDHSCNNDCYCPVTVVSFVVPFKAETTSNIVLDNRYQGFFTQNFNLSAGFTFIWLPPKIS